MEPKMDTKGFVTVVVAEETCNPGSRYFLAAPTNYHFDINDEVISKVGREFKVLFASSYVPIKSELYIALTSAFGAPGKVVMYKAVNNVEWGDED